MIKFARGAFALLAITSPATSWAQQPGGAVFISPMGQPFQGDDPMQAWFSTADADHDGSVSLAEFQADAQVFFARADASQDQAITSVESTALLQREAPQVLSPVYAGPPIDPHAGPTGRRHHPEDDRPDNPSASGSLIWRHPGPAGPRRQLTGAARFGLFDVGDAVMSCDSDFSRRVTAAEFSACAAQRFAEVDADHNGAITLEEVRAKRAALVDGPAN